MTGLLIDTQVFLWFETRSTKLSERVRDRISRMDQAVMLSAASVWEIAIKQRTGKLAFTGPLAEAVAASGFTTLPIEAEDAEMAGGLDWDHKDPFDRILLAQCIHRGLSLVTADATLALRREAPIVWAGQT